MTSFKNLILVLGFCLPAENFCFGGYDSPLEGFIYPNMVKLNPRELIGQEFSKRFENGGTLLHKAVEDGNIDLVKLLMKYAPADVLLVKDRYGLTILHLARVLGYIEIAAYLEMTVPALLAIPRCRL